MRDGRASQLIGEGAEEAWCYELRRLGAVCWRNRRAQSVARANSDIFDAFDVLALSDRYVLLCQVKAHKVYMPPSPQWLARVAPLPRPPHLRLLWVTWQPDQTWRVERLRRDGSLEALPWPPSGEEAA